MCVKFEIIYVHTQSTQMLMLVKLEVSNTNTWGVTDINVKRNEQETVTLNFLDLCMVYRYTCVKFEAANSSI